MTDTIFAGDGNTILQATIKENGVIVPLTGCSVNLDFRVKSRTFNKVASIVDDVNGIVEVALTGDDIADPGTYFFRGHVTFSNGDSFHSDKDYFNVEKATV